VAPSVIEREVLDHYAVQVIGRAPAVRQRVFAISMERRIAHPAVAAVCDLARRDIFASRKQHRRSPLGRARRARSP
jgi:LysR family transcriptional activator of nhaA